MTPGALPTSSNSSRGAAVISHVLTAFFAAALFGILIGFRNDVMRYEYQVKEEQRTRQMMIFGFCMASDPSIVKEKVEYCREQAMVAQ